MLAKFQFDFRPKPTRILPETNPALHGRRSNDLRCVLGMDLMGVHMHCFLGGVLDTTPSNLNISLQREFTPPKRVIWLYSQIKT